MGVTGGGCSADGDFDGKMDWENVLPKNGLGRSLLHVHDFRESKTNVY